MLSALPANDDAAVVFVGSWGRCEVTSQSDNDFLVLGRTDAARASPTIADVVAALGDAEGGFKAPSTDGPFAHPWSLEQLQAVLGRPEDTNATLTVRMLLVLESVAVFNTGFHREAREALIGHYPSHRSSRTTRPACFSTT